MHGSLLDDLDDIIMRHVMRKAYALRTVLDTLSL